MQIIAPADKESVPPSIYALGERIGNVSSEVTLVLASLMDFDDASLPECNVYNVGFRFQCILVTDSHHKAEGYDVNIIVLSINSDSFTDKMMDLLNSKGLVPHRIL